MIGIDIGVGVAGVGSRFEIDAAELGEFDIVVGGGHSSTPATATAGDVQKAR